MHPYGVRDVEKLLRLPRSTIRALIQAGFVSPARGPRRAWLFSFQDLIVLRTAQALSQAKVPRGRITRSVRQLRRYLPEAMPLSGLSISAVGDRVVVRQGGSRWQADSGQYLLAFEGDPAEGSMSVVPRPDTRNARDARDLLGKALALEGTDRDGALLAYREAVAADPALLDAQVNLGCLLHESGDLKGAEQVYRDALEPCANAPSLLYNLAVLLEDAGRKPEAIAAYERALQGDPDLADGHYNLALLCEEVGKAKEAIRHMARYRKLTGHK